MPFDEQTLAALFNEWMRRYINDPEGFADDFELCEEFIDDKVNDREPAYGRTCVAYLKKLRGD